MTAAPLTKEDLKELTTTIDRRMTGIENHLSEHTDLLREHTDLLREHTDLLHKQGGLLEHMSSNVHIVIEGQTNGLDSTRRAMVDMEERLSRRITTLEEVVRIVARGQDKLADEVAALRRSLARHEDLVALEHRVSDLEKRLASK